MSVGGPLVWADRRDRLIAMLRLDWGAFVRLRTKRTQDPGPLRQFVWRNKFGKEFQGSGWF